MKSTIAKVTARVIVLMVMIAALASPLFAQTSGRIVGTIEDAQGAVLPGVTVTVTSPAAAGREHRRDRCQRAVPVSDASSRRVSRESGARRLQVGRTTTSASGSIRQSRCRSRCRSPAWPRRSTSWAPRPWSTRRLRRPAITAGPGRLQPAARGARLLRHHASWRPGSRRIPTVASINGSTSAENQYIIDGLNTTGVNTGTEGKTLNFDFVQEVEVKTGGLNAEYGRLTGGAVNVVTKSGGNAFHGDVFGFGEGGGLQAANVTGAKLPQTHDQRPQHRASRRLRRRPWRLPGQGQGLVLRRVRPRRPARRGDDHPSARRARQPGGRQHRARRHLEEPVRGEGARSSSRRTTPSPRRCSAIRRRATARSSRRPTASSSSSTGRPAPGRARSIRAASTPSAATTACSATRCSSASWAVSTARRTSTAAPGRPPRRIWIRPSCRRRPRAASPPTTTRTSSATSSRAT